MSTETLATAVDYSIHVTPEWSLEKILDLVKYWDDGLSTNKISDVLSRKWGNISKNAVVGKAHRIDLKPRPSPIIRNAGSQPKPPAPPPRPRATSLPPLPSVAAAAVAGILAAAPAPAVADIEVPAIREEIVVSQPRTAPPPPPPPAPVYVPRPVECSWPIGEPGKPGFRFCDAESEPGKPYCGEHCKLAYVPVSKRAAADEALLRRAR